MNRSNSPTSSRPSRAHTSARSEKNRRVTGLSDVTVKVYPDARHEVFNEINSDEVVGDLVAWLGSHVPS